MQVRGPVIGLLDSEGEFAAYRYENGQKTELVRGWQKTIKYEIHRDYIGLLDSDGIVDVYSALESKKLISNWRNTVQSLFAYDYIRHAIRGKTFQLAIT